MKFTFSEHPATTLKPSPLGWAGIKKAFSQKITQSPLKTPCP